MDSRIGALEILIQNLYAHRYLADPDPLTAVDRAAQSMSRLGQSVRIKGDGNRLNALASVEARAMLERTFLEIRRIVRANMSDPNVPGGNPALTNPLAVEDRIFDYVRAKLAEAGRPVPKDAPLKVLETLTGASDRVLRLGYGDPQRTVILKLPSHHQIRAHIGQGLRFYEREARFYTEAAPTTAVPVPQLIAAAWMARDGFDAIVMEDLSGQRCGDQLAGATPAEAKAVVETVAKLHGRWWDKPELAFDWLPKWDDSAAQAMVAGAYSHALNHLKRTAADKLSAETLEILDLLPQVLPAIVSRIGSRPQTLVHGDLRMNNILFDAAGQPNLVDFQICSTGRGTVDIAYFLSQSLTEQTRRAHEGPLLDAYVAALAKAGVKDYGIDKCREDYALGALNCLVYPVIAAASFDQPDVVLVAISRAIDTVKHNGGVELMRKLKAPEPKKPGP